MEIFLHILFMYKKLKMLISKLICIYRVSLIIGIFIFIFNIYYYSNVSLQNYFKTSMIDYQRQCSGHQYIDEHIFYRHPSGLNNDVNRTMNILSWCDSHGNKKYFWEFGSDKFHLTEDRDMLASEADFDAILFHQRSINLRRDRPQSRRAEQRYVHWMFESPAHLFYDVTPLSEMNNFFNWSISYRLDSTFPTPYGSFRLV